MILCWHIHEYNATIYEYKKIVGLDNSILLEWDELLFIYNW